LLIVEIFSSERKLEENGFRPSHVHHGSSQDGSCRVHRELNKITHVESIMGFAKITGIASRADYLEMKDPLDISKSAQGMRRIYQGQKQIGRDSRGRLSEPEPSQSRGLSQF
jgi:hypothetical protein